ncbi:MAG TPA: Crp/Fnr family transcriptional regulator [Bryobacteraceae bacterium]|jgi:CRP/FNR family transcriptional regulator|nr:Crp/Fnr family transcriptional regulator [Bryobacteraceae bacterium]
MIAASRGHVATDRVAALRQSDFFASLTDDLLKKIAEFAVVRHLERGQILFSEYDKASGLYVVISGELRSVRQSADGREQVLSTERAGAILAAAPVLTEGKFFSTVIADTSADVLRIEKRHFYELCNEHTELLWKLATALAHKVRRYAELIETLALQNVEQRLARYLLTVAQDRGIRLGDGCTFELTLTRAETASRLGSAREVISRAFTHLNRAGLIHMEGRRLVVIPNIQALGKFAGVQHELREGTSVSKISWEMV